jgi:hypothetical protein
MIGKNIKILYAHSMHACKIIFPSHGMGREWKGFLTYEKATQEQLQLTLAYFTFSSLFRPFCTFSDPKKYASRTVLEACHWKTIGNRLNRKSIGGIDFSSGNRP